MLKRTPDRTEAFRKCIKHFSSKRNSLVSEAQGCDIMRQIMRFPTLVQIDFISLLCYNSGMWEEKGFIGDSEAYMETATREKLAKDAKKKSGNRL